MKLEVRIATYVSKELSKWLRKEAVLRGLNESAIIRELLTQKMNEARNVR